MVYKDEDGKEHFEGYCADLAKAICRVLNIDYKLQLVKDGMYGEKRKNGTWSGMVGELTRKVRPRVVLGDKFRLVETLRLSAVKLEDEGPLVASYISRSQKGAYQNRTLDRFKKIKKELSYC